VVWMCLERPGLQVPGWISHRSVVRQRYRHCCLWRGYLGNGAGRTPRIPQHMARLPLRSARHCRLTDTSERSGFSRFRCTGARGPQVPGWNSHRSVVRQRCRHCCLWHGYLGNGAGRNPRIPQHMARLPLLAAAVTGWRFQADDDPSATLLSGAEARLAVAGDRCPSRQSSPGVLIDAPPLDQAPSGSWAAPATGAVAGPRIYPANAVG
jgi:hypothetical protein